MNFLKNSQTNWKYIFIVVILAILAGGGIFGYLRYFQKEMVSLSKFPEIKKPEKIEEETPKLAIETLKNAEYYSLFLKKRIKLTNGVYSEPPPEPRMASHCEVVIYKDKIALGDLNNDGKDDAAVILDGTCGGSGSFRELAIIINQDGRPYYLTSKDLGDRVIINSINIDLGIITLDMIIHGPNGGMCCPTVQKIFKYRLSENQLIEVIEEETADWKTYRNEEYEFEIKYPQNWYWSVYNFAEETDIAFCSPSFYDGKECAEHYKGTQAPLIVLFIKKEKTTGERCDWECRTWCEVSSIIVDKRESEFLNCNAEKIGGLPEESFLTVYWEKDNKTPYEYELRVYGLTYSSQYQTIFNQMLSTFRFFE